MMTADGILILVALLAVALGGPAVVWMLHRMTTATEQIAEVMRAGHEAELLGMREIWKAEQAQRNAARVSVNIGGPPIVPPAWRPCTTSADWPWDKNDPRFKRDHGQVPFDG